MSALATPLAPPPAQWFERGTPGLDARMPLLAEALAAVALRWTEGFAALTATPVTLAFKGLKEARVAALPARRGRDPVFAALDVPGWGTGAALQLDRAFVSTALEALFGGEADGGESPEGPLSPVEARIAEVVAVQACDALKAGFAEVLPSPFVFERLLPKPDLGFLGRPNAGVVVATLALKALGRSGEIDLLVPRAALDAFAERLAVLPADEPAGADPRWSERMEDEVSRAPMQLSAVMDLASLTLGALSRLRVGQVLALPRDVTAEVRLVCEGRDLFRCDLGQSAGHYTVRVGEALPER